MYSVDYLCRDSLYTVDTSGSGVSVVLTEVTGTETTVMGLTPAVYYTFLVTAENDVSFQDSNVNVRSANITATTDEGGMYTVILSHSFMYMYIHMYMCMCTCTSNSTVKYNTVQPTTPQTGMCVCYTHEK